MIQVSLRCISCIACGYQIIRKGYMRSLQSA